MEGFFLPMRIGLVYTFLLLACFALCSCNNPRVPKAVVEVAPAEKPASADSAVVSASADTAITIAAVGDMMLGTAYPNSNSLPPDSGKNSFRYALKDLREADIAFGNLEGALIDSGVPAAMKLKFRSKPYLFKMPEYYGGVFKDAGFDILSVANNHSNDFGLKGRKTTVRILDSLGIHHAGLKTSPVKTFTRKGVKYGFCAFSPNSQTVSLLDIKAAAAIIQELKRQSDVVIVSFHGGGEGVSFEHVPCVPESYNGERRGNVNAFTHAAVDAGADVVLGNGPHVSRAIELYKDRLIAYSLGNFCTYRSVSVAGICGLAPMLKLRINKNGRVV
jgi:poly-gamma-glutamate capsule biosynthesis protein CapA/YwtB (metallophosphatase superfamily)